MKTQIKRPFILVMYGPTGVGKTDLALQVAEHIPSEIINMDVGQFYTPLTIGTAKPDWKNSPTKHHLFDIIDNPMSYTVTEYRNQAYAIAFDIMKRGKLPIFVGGSGFYLYSLLFTQPIIPHSRNHDTQVSTVDLWQQLHTIDPARAAQINPADTYRIKRALEIWHTTGNLPSAYAPEYNPQADYLIIFVERDRQELKKRINDRVLTMIEDGWILETQKLCNTPWQDFIRTKNLIGYREIFDYLDTTRSKQLLEQSIELIQDQTRQYAKRQFTFWRKLEREIKKEKRYTGSSIGCLDGVNLTNVTIDSYINELLKQLSVMDKKIKV